MAAGAADGMFRSIFEGCISGCDAAIERRPYHKNCSCALHERSRGGKKQSCNHARPPKRKTVSYPIRRSWSEGSSLALHLAPASSSSSLSSLSSSSSLTNLASHSPSSSPALAAAAEPGRSHQLRWTIDEDDDDSFSFQGLNY